jgi:hypothetical protein
MAPTSFAAHGLQKRNKAIDPATRIYVGTPDDWQRMVEGWNTVGLGGIVRRVFEDRDAATDWMGFRV